MKKLTTPLLMVGSTLTNSDLRYAVGLSSVDPLVALRTNDGCYLLVPAMEFGRAQEEARRGVTILTPADLQLKKRDRRKFSAWILALLRKLGVRRVRVAGDFPIALALRLEQRGVIVMVQRAKLFPERRAKTAAEIRAITVTQRAAVAGMRRAMSLIAGARVGRGGVLFHGGRRLTSEAVRREVEAALLERDCWAPETIVACGSASANPHSRGSGSLRAGRPIVIDIFPQHRVTGYWGDLTRTVVKGRAGDELKRMYAAVKEAQAQGRARVRHGASARGIHAAVHRVFRQRGFATAVREGKPEGFIHGTGHGVGLDIHEAPSISEGTDRLRARDVVTIEPGLYYPQQGGVRIEDLVVVSRSGCKVLVKCPLKFEV